MGLMAVAFPFVTKMTSLLCSVLLCGGGLNANLHNGHQELAMGND